MMECDNVTLEIRCSNLNRVCPRQWQLPLQHMSQATLLPVCAAASVCSLAMPSQHRVPLLHLFRVLLVCLKTRTHFGALVMA